MTTVQAPAKIALRQRLAILLLLGTGFMLSVDFSILNVALPRLGADVGLRVSELPWVIGLRPRPASSQSGAHASAGGTDLPRGDTAHDAGSYAGR
jgi:hypothetical protein